MQARLAEIISRIPPGVSVIDVGCDHGFAAIELAKRGNILTASDIAEAPLNTAKENARRAGLEDRITFVRCDGVPADIASTIDCVIIAGMGGETIAGILENAPGLKRPGVTLVLQPQTKKALLLEALFRNSWNVVQSECMDHGRKYYVFTCAYGNGRVDPAPT